MDAALENRRALNKDYVSEMVGHPIKNYSIVSSGKGDNVIGKMLALQVELEEGDSDVLHIVLKSLYPLLEELNFMSILQGRFFSSLKVFPVEMTFYNVIRPILREISGKEYNTPRYYSGVSDGVNDYICLEDLRPKGYKVADKFQGLNLEEVNCILEKIADLHAHSYAVIQGAEKQGKFERIGELLKDSVLKGHIWDRPLQDMLDQSVFYNAIIEKMVEVLREQGEVTMAEKMTKYTKTGHKIMVDLWKTTEYPPLGGSGKEDKYFKVIIHGDLHTHNVLIKYPDSGKPLQADHLAFIDFQQCRFGNIYEDLLYFIFTSTTAEFRKQNLRPCLIQYARNFINALQSLPGNILPPMGYSEESVIATFYENIEYGFVYNLVGIPFQLGIQAQAPQEASSPPPSSPPSEPPTATQMALGQAEVLKQATKNSPIAIQRLKEMCQEMIKLNVL